MNIVCWKNIVYEKMATTKNIERYANGFKSRRTQTKTNWDYDLSEKQNRIFSIANGCMRSIQSLRLFNMYLEKIVKTFEDSHCEIYIKKMKSVGNLLSE